jgi:chromosome segregation ATPase
MITDPTIELVELRAEVARYRELYIKNNKQKQDEINKLNETISDLKEELEEWKEGFRNSERCCQEAERLVNDYRIEMSDMEERMNAFECEIDALRETNDLYLTQMGDED